MWQSRKCEDSNKVWTPLTILAQWWGHGKWFCEAFLSNEPEGLFCAFALIENIENLKHTINLKKSFWSIWYKHLVWLSNCLCFPFVTTPWSLPSYVASLSYTPEAQASSISCHSRQMESEHHIKLPSKCFVYPLPCNSIFKNVWLFGFIASKHLDAQLKSLFAIFALIFWH